MSIVVGVTWAPSSPDLPQVMAYLQAISATTYTEDQVETALKAESDLQARTCRVEQYSAALAEALCRRVHRNLTMRGVPLGVQMSEAGGTRIGSTDPEVRRLEAPYRRLVLG